MPAKHVPIKDGDLEAKALISADSGRAVNTCLPARLSFFTEESENKRCPRVAALRQVFID